MTRTANAAAAAFAVAIGLAACAGGPDDAALVAQARAALARWADQAGAAGPGGIVITSELTGQIGAWEEAVGDNNKAALMFGLVESAGALPDDPVPAGEIRWADGHIDSVRLVTAAAAFAEIAGDGAGDCGGCEPIGLRDPVLRPVDVTTSQGPAQVPAWHFRVDGSGVVVTRVAVADTVRFIAPEWNADDPPSGISIESAVGGPGDTTIVVRFVGAPGPGSEPCGADYTASAVESDLALVVLVRDQRHAALEACPAVGALRWATVELAAPLAGRAVLEVKEGRPVPVSPR